VFTQLPSVHVCELEQRFGAQKPLQPSEPQVLLLH
jgi:hypothetical protein